MEIIGSAGNLVNEGRALAVGKREIRDDRILLRLEIDGGERHRLGRQGVRHMHRDGERAVAAATDNHAAHELRTGGKGCTKQADGEDQGSSHGFSGYRMAFTSGWETMVSILSATRSGVRASTSEGYVDGKVQSSSP